VAYFLLGHPVDRNYCAVHIICMCCCFCTKIFKKLFVSTRRGGHCKSADTVWAVCDL